MRKAIAWDIREVRLMRTLVCLALACVGCSSKPVTTDNEQAASSPGRIGQVQMNFYRLRVPKNGEVMPPPLVMRLSGTLAEKNDCLILLDHALVFQEGLASFDRASARLKVGSAEFAIGDPISVGGPFNSPSAEFDATSLQRRCGVSSVWLVTRQDVKPFP